MREGARKTERNLPRTRRAGTFEQVGRLAALMNGPALGSLLEALESVRPAGGEHVLKIKRRHAQCISCATFK